MSSYYHPITYDSAVYVMDVMLRGLPVDYDTLDFTIKMSDIYGNVVEGNFPSSGNNSNVHISINTDGSEAHPSAILDIKSTDKGFLMPRMTNTQIQAISNPADGLMVYSTTDHIIYFFVDNDNEWKAMDGSGTITPS